MQCWKILFEYNVKVGDSERAQDSAICSVTFWLFLGTHENILPLLCWLRVDDDIISTECSQNASTPNNEGGTVTDIFVSHEDLHKHTT